MLRFAAIILTVFVYFCCQTGHTNRRRRVTANASWSSPITWPTEQAPFRRNMTGGAPTPRTWWGRRWRLSSAPVSSQTSHSTRKMTLLTRTNNTITMIQVCGGYICTDDFTVMINLAVLDILQSSAMKSDHTCW